jgi:hypothetical protein
MRNTQRQQSAKRTYNNLLAALGDNEQTRDDIAHHLRQTKGCIVETANALAEEHGRWLLEELYGRFHDAPC